MRPSKAEPPFVPLFLLWGVSFSLGPGPILNLSVGACQRGGSDGRSNSSGHEPSHETHTVDFFVPFDVLVRILQGRSARKQTDMAEETNEAEIGIDGLCVVSLCSQNTNAVGVYIHTKEKMKALVRPV